MIYLAFRDVDQSLITLCTADEVNLNKLNELIADGADVNAFDKEYEQVLYEEILDYYIFEGRERQINLSNLYTITEIFVKNGLVLNQQSDDSDYFLLDSFRFLPPERVCVDTFCMLLERCNFSHKDVNYMIADTILDVHMGIYYFLRKRSIILKKKV